MIVTRRSACASRGGKFISFWAYAARVIDLESTRNANQFVAGGFSSRMRVRI